MNAVFDIVDFPKRDTKSPPKDVGSGSRIPGGQSASFRLDKECLPNTEVFGHCRFVFSNRMLLNTDDTCIASGGEAVWQASTSERDTVAFAEHRENSVETEHFLANARGVSPRRAAIRHGFLTPQPARCSVPVGAASHGME
jgi:hypothetical protein